MYFGLNYVAVYYAERYVASGLVAVVFSAIVFTSAIGMRVVFGTPLTARMIAAATLGCAGIALLFLPELASMHAEGTAVLGIAFAVVSLLLATGGNLVAVRNQRDGLPLFPSTAWGMAYGTLLRRDGRAGDRRRVDLRPAAGLRRLARSTSRCSAASSRSALTSRC